MQLQPLHTSLLLLTIALRFSHNDAVVFKFTNFVCENYNKTWIELHQCRLKALNRNKTVLNLEFTSFYPIYEISVEMQLYKKANWYSPWLLKTSLDCCRFLKKPYNAFAIIVYKMFEPFTNINHPCPMEGKLYVKGLHLQPDLMPLPLPTGEYLLGIQWFLHKRLEFVTNAYFSFVEDL